MSRRISMPLAILITVGCLPTEALADDDAQAREHFERAQVLRHDGKLRSAIVELQASFAASPRPKRLTDIAALYERLAETEQTHNPEAARIDARQAIEHYQRYLQAARSTSGRPPGNAAEVAQKIAAMEAILARLPEKPPSPASATPLPPQAPATPADRQEPDLPAEAVDSASLAKPTPKAPPIAPVPSVANDQPLPMMVPPPSASPPPPKESSAAASRGSSSSGSGRRKAGIAVLVVGLAVAGTGAALVGSSIGPRTDAASQKLETLDAYYAHLSPLDQRQGAGWALLGIGGAAVLVGTIAAVLPAQPSERRSLLISPTLGGLQASGVF